MQITIELKELQDYQTALKQWAYDRAVALAAIVPVRINPDSSFTVRDPEALKKQLDKAVAATPMPLLIPPA
jgi:hypothetical protein